MYVPVFHLEGGSPEIPHPKDQFPPPQKKRCCNEELCGVGNFEFEPVIRKLRQLF